jgi:molybdopterin-guanine dinucleotide biosynthesis protein A
MVHGKPMARVIADIMRAANIDEVLAVGDSQVTADAIELPFVSDLYPGEGPLGGLISAMRQASTEILCVMPCDVPRMNASRIRQLVDSVVDCGEIDAAVVMTTREHWLCSCWRIPKCLPVFEKCFTGGERAIHRAIGSFAIQRVMATDAEMMNVNTIQEAAEIGRIVNFEVGD